MGFQKFAQSLGGTVEVLAIVIDHSMSMGESDYHPNRLAACKKAGTALLELKARSAPNDQVGLVAFGSEATVAHPLVAVREGQGSLLSALAGLTCQGGTNMEAGMREATKLVLTGGPKRRPQRRFLSSLWGADEPIGGEDAVRRIICCTDGGFGSLRAAREAADKAKSHGIVVDVIGIAGSRTSSGFHEDHCMAVASDDPMSPCGKRYVFVEDTAQLVEEFKQRANLIRRAN